MVLYDHRSIYVLHPRFLIPGTQKVIKPDLTEFTARKQGAVSDQ